MTGQTLSTARTVSDAFSEFEEALNLDEREVRSARERHNAVRDCLTATSMVSDSFLQGSFARKTMVSPLHDVDVVLLLPLRDRPLLTSPGGAAVSMERLKPALTVCFPGVIFDCEKHADHALRLDFPDTLFHIDLVPAFDLNNTNGDIEIADRKLDEWEWSNTRQLMRDVAARNVLTLGRFIHQTRMVKTFTTVADAIDVCGLVGESLAYDAITRHMSDPQALLAVFECGSKLTSGSLTDPTGVDDLLEGWTWDRRQRAADVFSRAASRAREALSLAASGDEPAAVSLWHSILGDSFPSAPGGGNERDLFKSGWALSSNNRITTAPAVATVVAPPTRAHRTK